jgi:hypothetical protein
MKYVFEMSSDDVLLMGAGLDALKAKITRFETQVQGEISAQELAAAAALRQGAEAEASAAAEAKVTAPAAPKPKRSSKR